MIHPSIQKSGSGLSGKNESFLAIPWDNHTTPQKILAVRLQALGDTVITLPYLQGLKNILPSTEFHFLTREEFGDIPRNMKMFDNVLTIKGGRDVKLQLLNSLFLLPRLWKEKYDIVIDLQRNRVSRMIRRALHPQSFSEFDRFSLKTAGDRTRATINDLDFQSIPEIPANLQLREKLRGMDRLREAGYDPAKKFIVLNPAGSHLTKCWPLENYVGLAKKWIDLVDTDVRFLILGVKEMREKALYLKEKLGDRLINLVEKTTPSEAFNILRQAELVVTEDSGLMHMAWVAQVPVVALFGSTRSAWSRPMGASSVCLDSSDLECGECLQPLCRYGDVHCLSRHSPEAVIAIAKKLLSERNHRSE